MVAAAKPTMRTTETNTRIQADPTSEKLAYTGAEVNEILGGISDVTRWRLEKRGLLARVPGLRRPLYSRRSVHALIDAEAADT